MRDVCMGEFEGYVCGSVVCGNVVYVGVRGGNQDREHVSLLILSTKNSPLLFFSLLHFQRSISFSSSPIPLPLPPSSLSLSLFFHTHW